MPSSISSKTLGNVEKGFLYFQKKFPLKNENQNGKSEKKNVALITHNAP